MIKTLGMLLIVISGLGFMGIGWVLLIGHVIDWEWPTVAESALISVSAMLTGHMLVAISGNKSG